MKTITRTPANPKNMLQMSCIIRRLVSVNSKISDTAAYNRKKDMDCNKSK